MNNKTYAKTYATQRGLKDTTRERVNTVIDHYSEYQGMTMHELIIEADTEEEAGVRWKRRTLKQRLINYMNYCKQTMLLSSAQTYFTTVKAVYLHFEIEIGQLPKWNSKNANVPNPITSKDMLTKEIIREALKIANPVMRCIILTEASSGMTRSDVLDITIGQFLEATHQYHYSDNVQVAVKLMLESDVDMIPSFHLRRKKNNKYFITFISPEATREICKYLRLRDKRNHKYHRPLLTHIDPLFKIANGTYIDKFNELNTQLNGGKAGTYNRLRGHNLRKFHATSLEKYGMSRYLVNVLQGKSNNDVDDRYFIEDEDTLRDEYLKALEGVLIYTDVKEVNKYSVEYQQLELENKEYKQKLDLILDRIAKLEER